MEGDSGLSICLAALVAVLAVDRCVGYLLGLHINQTVLWMNLDDLSPGEIQSLIVLYIVFNVEVECVLRFPVQCWLMMRLWPWPVLSKENQAEGPADCNTTSGRTAKDFLNEKVQPPLVEFQSTMKYKEQRIY